MARQYVADTVWSGHARDMPRLLMQPIHVDGACSPDDSGATRMQDEAGHAPADRRRSDARSDARDNRLQTTAVNMRPCLHAGERNNPCSPAFASISNPSPRQGSAGARLWPALDPITRFFTEAQKGADR